MKSWNKETIHSRVESQRKLFLTGKTLDVNFRIRQLKKLRNTVAHYEKELEAALRTMLGIHADVHLVSPKSITRSEGKAVRVIDKRKLY